MDIESCNIGEKDQAIMVSDIKTNNLTIFYLVDDKAIIDIDDGKGLTQTTLDLETFEKLHLELTLALKNKQKHKRQRQKLKRFLKLRAQPIDRKSNFNVRFK